jgi:hypothetical protein
MSVVAVVVLTILIGQMYDSLEKERLILDLSDNLRKIQLVLSDYEIKLAEKTDELRVVEIDLSQRNSMISGATAQQSAISESLAEASFILRNDLEEVEKRPELSVETRTELLRIRTELTSQLSILTENINGIISESDFNQASIKFSFFSVALANGGSQLQRPLSKYYFGIVFLCMLGVALLASLGAAYLSSDTEKQKSGEKMAHAIIGFIIGGFSGSVF